MLGSASTDNTEVQAWDFEFLELSSPELVVTSQSLSEISGLWQVPEEIYVANSTTEPAKHETGESISKVKIGTNQS